jgi:hypothetical protein
MVLGFRTLTQRHGVEVGLPGGGLTRGLFDLSTKAESLNNVESQIMAGDPSVVIAEKLKIGDPIAVSNRAYTIRAYESDPDGQLTRYFLAEAMT